MAHKTYFCQSVNNLYFEDYMELKIYGMEQVLFYAMRASCQNEEWRLKTEEIKSEEQKCCDKIVGQLVVYWQCTRRSDAKSQSDVHDAGIHFSKQMPLWCYDGISNFNRQLSPFPLYRHIPAFHLFLWFSSIPHILHHVTLWICIFYQENRSKMEIVNTDFVVLSILCGDWGILTTQQNILL